jgi:hypothetical protein
VPQFAWTGRDKTGNTLTGNLQAESKEEVIRKLLTSHVAVTDVRDVDGESLGEVRGRDYKRTFKFLFLALMIIVGAAAMTLLSPVDVIRCTPDRSCTVEHSLAGVYVMDREQAANLTAAEGTTNRVTISGPGGKIETFPKSTSMPSNKMVTDSMKRYLAAPNGNYIMLQTEVIFLIPIALVLVALHFLRLAFRA